MATDTRPTTEQTPDMPPVYRAAEVETEIYERWLAADVFAPDGRGSRANDSKPPFVITQPPPNVTGALHIGHALTSTVEDVMIRRARMQGHPTLFLPGVDHASIAAQFVLDKIIAAEGETRDSLGRERYLERMWAFVKETRDVIADQQRRLGISADWGRLRFTMDEGSAEAVRVAFKRLYDDGLAYRGEKLINWCPGDQTSLSDLEVIATPTTGTLWHIRYHFVDDHGRPLPTETITVATTRPETNLGDTAVAVHPDDPALHVRGRPERSDPVRGSVVPVIADDVVQREFGSGRSKSRPRTTRRIRHRPAPWPADHRRDDRRRADQRAPGETSPGSAIGDALPVAGSVASFAEPGEVSPVLVDLPVVGHHVDDREAVSLAGGEIIVVVGRRDLDHAAAERGLDDGVGDDRHEPVHERDEDPPGRSRPCSAGGPDEPRRRCRRGSSPGAWWRR